MFKKSSHRIQASLLQFTSFFVNHELPKGRNLSTVARTSPPSSSGTIPPLLLASLPSHLFSSSFTIYGPDWRIVAPGSPQVFPGSSTLRFVYLSRKVLQLTPPLSLFQSTYLPSPSQWDMASPRPKSGVFIFWDTCCVLFLLTSLFR